MTDVIECDWAVILPRLARAAYNAHMAEEWDDLSRDSIERTVWLQTIAAVVNEMQMIMDETLIDWTAAARRKILDELTAEGEKLGLGY